MNTNNDNRVKSKFLAALVAALPLVMLTSPAEAKHPDIHQDGVTYTNVGNDLLVKNCAYHSYGFKTSWPAPTNAYNTEGLFVRDHCRPLAKIACHRYGSNLASLLGYTAWSSQDEIRHGAKKKDGLHVDAKFACWKKK